MLSDLPDSIYERASPLFAEGVNQSLVHFSKIHKVMVEFTSKISSIYNETACSMLSSLDIFTKKIADIDKTKIQGQNESYIKFINKFMEQFESHAKLMQNLSNSFNDCVVVPLKNVVEKKKEIWTTCFHYIDSFQQQIVKKEEDLAKRYKDYSDCCAKIKTSENVKYQKMCHNSHNTYLLRLSSVNSMNNLLYKHVIPQVLHFIEVNHNELNDSLRHHAKYMFSMQKDSFKKMIKSVEKVDHAATKIDLLSDLKKYYKLLKAKDKNPPYRSFTSAMQDLGRRSSVNLETMKEEFIINKFTQPNLQRRLASLEYQTGELVDTIAAMRSNKNVDDELSNKTQDPALNELIFLLKICDKEANLNVLLKQMELYTPEVIDFLEPMPENILKERLHENKSFNQMNGVPTLGEKPHDFAEPKLLKHLFCIYCSKLIILSGKGLMCKVCKVGVHKKCAFNIPFCNGDINKNQKLLKSNSEEKVQENSVVYDLIDIDEDFYEDDEFNDGLSDSDGDLLNFSQPVLCPSKTASSLTSCSSSQTKDTQNPQVSSKNSLLKLSQTVSHEINQVVSTTNSNIKPPICSNVKPPVSKKPSLNKKISRCEIKEFCVTLYDFQATCSSEISFTAGKRIEVIDHRNLDWWQGKFDNSTGYFPSKYVMMVAENDRILKAIYSFQSEGCLELTVHEGEIVVLLEENGEWLKVKSLDGEGLVPSSYLEYLF
ncbi:uncharacterized protein LOC105846925 [Hydra vulgaris]|uniref:Uncharacterized protein LOC105846925 n=1 Tax=Hydra vulgaris TaxID=6087 RepID=A0ABM4D7T3_HYDVU